MRPCSGCNKSISGKANRTHQFCDNCRKILISKEEGLSEVDCYGDNCTGRAKFVKDEDRYAIRYKCECGHDFVLCRQGFA